MLKRTFIVLFILAASLTMLSGFWGCKPKITSQPADLNIEKNVRETTLSVTASGSDPLAYQWERSDVLTKGSVWLPVVGATRPFLTLSVSFAQDHGDMFRCVVSNKYGKVTSAPSTLRFVFALRDTGPAGGLIFYDKGNYSDGWRYLEAAPGDQESKVKWYRGTYITTGANGTAPGTGKTNTAVIVSAQGAGTYAAMLCDNLSLTHNGISYDDWFLPSKDELNLMFMNLKNKGYGGFQNLNYWSSTEAGETHAWYKDFRFGASDYHNKSIEYTIRAVRAF